MTAGEAALTSSELQRPLVTFALITYNQRPYIREAIDGAFAQTYTPLEIIISDDSSVDGTFELVSEMVSAYRGPHQVRVHRNQKNLGIGAHVNKVLRMASGKWVVMAAGDDVSLDTRVSRTMQYVFESHRELDCVAVALKEIDSMGAVTGVIRNRLSAGLPIGALDLAGAGLAYSRRVIDCFGELNDGVHNEDIVLSARALLLSGIGLLPEPLVLYRSHEANRPRVNRRFGDFSSQWVESKRREIARTKALYVQIKKDLAGWDEKRIPDYHLFLERVRHAEVLEQILDRGRPVSIQGGFTAARNLALLKCWIGALIARMNSV